MSEGRIDREGRRSIRESRLLGRLGAVLSILSGLQETKEALEKG